ncbi:hypothetical protein NYO91_15935 [Arhodomonas aquaeolei]|uniref:hypothetical protein n=2 Tax=Arhodomonas TaxID=2368 RepID=UPI002169A0E7|nr:hypothetical protein [Arhodomonas aquaeolei]MCS4505577.1 hypothetical protein [Arhodomonas aquaeolei]
MQDLHERILRAHGGESRWRSLARVAATADGGGSMFLAHMQPRPLREADIVVEPARFRVTIAPFEREDRVGVFEPRRVWVQERDGRLVGERGAPGTVTRSLRHWMVWDNLDLLFVLGISLWQALLLPMMLCRSGVTATQGSDQDNWLDVTLPGDLPVPAPEQRLHADAKGALVRAEYAPVAWGRTMRVAQLMESLEGVNGLVFATRQSLVPCFPGGAPVRAMPRLAWLEFSDLSVELAEPPPRE